MAHTGGRNSLGGVAGRRAARAAGASLGEFGELGAHGHHPPLEFGDPGALLVGEALLPGEEGAHRALVALKLIDDGLLACGRRRRPPRGAALGLSDAELARIAAAAREHTLTAHTATVRARELVAACEEARSDTHGRRPPPDDRGRTDDCSVVGRPSVGG